MKQEEGNNFLCLGNPNANWEGNCREEQFYVRSSYSNAATARIVKMEEPHADIATRNAHHKRFKFQNVIFYFFVAPIFSFFLDKKT